jgi:hypothetical protein
MKVKVNLGTINISSKPLYGEAVTFNCEGSFVETEFVADEYKLYIEATKEISAELIKLANAFMPNVVEAIQTEAKAKAAYYDRKDIPTPVI